mgnify:CR=1 FL=1
MAKESPEAKFDRLRTTHVAMRDELDKFESTIRRKYGPGWNMTWLSRAEETKLESLRKRSYESGKKFFDFVQSISPRDWSYDVPASWVREDLTFADAVRPVNESLSVVPPLSYGATVPRT